MKHHPQRIDAVPTFRGRDRCPWRTHRPTRDQGVLLRPSTRTPLLLSQIRPESINLRDERPAIVCPDCDRWHPLQRRMIKTHHLDRAVRGGKAPRCKGSARRIELDITIEEWVERLLAAESTATHRRATTVRRKPKRPVAPAVSRMLPVVYGATAARETFHAHRERCSACRGEALNGDGLQLDCADGRRLAAAYVRLLRNEPARAEARAAVARERARFDCSYTRQAARKNAASWAAQREATTEIEQLAKRAGTAVEEQNNTCRALSGTVSHLRGPGVPLEPPHITA